MPTPDDFRLSESDLARFSHYVQLQFLASVRAHQPAPTVRFVGGQSGSGKSLLTEALQRQEWDRCGGAVLVNSDLIRLMHPRYPEAQQAAALKASWLVQPDTTRVMGDLLRAATERRANVILDGTLAGSQPTLIEATMRSFRQQGYHVHIAVMGVHAAVSRLSIYKRYAEQVRAEGQGRWVSMANHDAQYGQVRDNLSHLIRSGLVDSTTIYRRALRSDAHDELVTEGANRNPDEALVTLDQARRPPVGAEREIFRGHVARVGALLEQLDQQDLRRQFEEHVGEALPRLPPRQRPLS